MIFSFPRRKAIVKPHIILYILCTYILHFNSLYWLCFGKKTHTQVLYILRNGLIRFGLPRGIPRAYTGTIFAGRKKMRQTHAYCAMIRREVGQCSGQDGCGLRQHISTQLPRFFYFFSHNCTRKKFQRYSPIWKTVWTL